MGNKDSRKVILSYEPSDGEKRTLLFDEKKGKHVWKSKGKVDCETLVTVKESDVVNFDIRPSAIISNPGDRLWKCFDYCLKQSPLAGFERIEQPPVQAKTDKLYQLNYKIDCKTSELIWFGVKFSTSSRKLAFGLKPGAVSVVTIESENKSTPFITYVWKLTLDNAGADLTKPFGINAAYLAEAALHFDNSYILKPWTWS